jgi:hypothetical protein
VRYGLKSSCERKFTGIAGGADLQDVIGESAPCPLQLLDDCEILRQSRETAALLGHRAARPGQVVVSDRRVENDLRPRHVDSET